MAAVMVPETPSPRHDAPGVAQSSAGVVSFAQRHRSMLLPFAYLGSAIRHLGWLQRLWNAPKDSLLYQFLNARPEIWQMLRVRFVSARWPAAERFRRLSDHCAIVEEMGPPFNLRPNEYVEVASLDEICDCKLTLDSPRWLLREGLLSLNITQRRDRIFSLAFIFAGQDDKLVAYVGGIQGRRGTDMLQRYRDFTKAANGARPQDIIVELFRMLCYEMGVSQILCVSDRIRNGQAAFERKQADSVDPVTFDYDALWTARGGTLRPDGFYELAVTAARRNAAQVPAKRRAQRARRNAMLAALHAKLAAALQHPEKIVFGQHEPSFP